MGTHNDVTMNGIQTSLAALQVGSAFAAKVPYIAPIVGLLLQVLTMRDVRVNTYLALIICVLMGALPGSKAIQRGVEISDAQAHQSRKLW
jgi:hypothetical protein